MNAFGKFIVIEGLDGSGSSTQAEMLASWLRKEGHKYGIGRVVRTWEPSDGPGGAVIRLSLSKRLALDEKTRTFLFAADRVDHLFNKNGIWPLLQDRELAVVCERYLLSFFAYQSFDAKSDLDWLQLVSAQCIAPTLIIWLDVSPKESLRRIVANRGFHQELYETHEQLAAIGERLKDAANKLSSDGFTVRRVSGEGTVRQVFNRVKVAVDSVLLPGYIPRSQWNQIFKRYPAVEDFTSQLQAIGLVPELREIQAGVQVVVFDDSDAAQLNVYGTGKVYIQGSASELKERVRKAIRLEAVSLPADQFTLFPDEGTRRR